MIFTGAGKQSAGSVYVAPELIRSIGTARILDLICEGPIVGLVNGDSSVYLDDTPLKDPMSGKYNFLNSDGTPAVTVSAESIGTPNQRPAPGFDQVESEAPVGAEVLHDQPVIRQIEAGLDRIRLRLAAPALYLIDGNGNTKANQIQYYIEVKDSSQADFPLISEVAQALDSATLALIPVPVSVPGYAKAWEGDLSAFSSAGKALGQLRYLLNMVNTLTTYAPTVTLEVWVASTSLDWTMLQSSSHRGATYGLGRPNPFTIDDTCEVYGKSKIQFRFNGATGIDFLFREAGEYGDRTYSAVTGYIFTGTYSKTEAGYFAITGPRFYGNHPSKFEISTYDYTLPGSGPWDIRVSKKTADSSDAKVQQTLRWESYTEIIDSKLSYPNCAVFGVFASAQQFTSIPRRGYHVKLLLVQVPSNCFPAARDAGGVWTMARYTRNALGEDTGVEQGWDGTFYMAWSSNPAWCYYDMVVHSRYGLGQYVRPQNVNKWELYTIGRYSDGAVDSGYRSAAGEVLYEPRFTLNCYITNRGQAYALLQYLAQAFRGMVYWSCGQVTATQDAPREPALSFTNANVIDGLFTYGGSAKRARHTAALVTWNDPVDLYRPATEYVDDPEGIRRYGFNPVNIPTVGCTSRGMAHRLGKWTLYSELSETETCTHRTGLEGAVAIPGEVYKVMDIGRSGVRWSGRVLESTSNRVTLDSAVTIEPGRQYSVTFITLADPPALVTVSVVAAGWEKVTDLLELAEDLQEAPLPGTPWVLECPDYIQAQLFRCLTVNEVAPGQFEIVGLEHNPSKYAMVEEGVQFDDPPVSGQLPLSSVLLPSGVQVAEETRLNTTGILETELSVSWDIVQQAAIQGYEAEYSVDGGSWLKLSLVGTNKAALVGAHPGSYSVRVRSLNVFGVPSAWVTAAHTIAPRSEDAPDVTGLQLLGQANDQQFLGRDANFEWRRAMPPGTVSSQLEDRSYGVGKVYPANWLNGYVITVKNLDGTVRSTDFAAYESWTYTFEKNSRDGDGVPARRFIVEVAAKTVWGTLSANPGRITVSNPAPAMLN